MVVKRNILVLGCLPKQDKTSELWLSEHIAYRETDDKQAIAAAAAVDRQIDAQIKKYRMMGKFNMKCSSF